MSRVFVLLLALSACGPSVLNRACPNQSPGTGCNCISDPAPIKCPGDWICNAQQRCEYMCAAPCENGACADQANFTCSNSLCRSNAALNLILCP